MQTHGVNQSSSHSYLGSVPGTPALVDFSQRLAALRRERGLTQEQLADRIQSHVQQFDAEEKQVVRSLLEGMILKHEARRWSGVTSGERK